MSATRRDLADQDKATWLMELDDDAIGYATAGPCGLPHEDARPDDGELYRIYVLKAFQGGGRGSLCSSKPVSRCACDYQSEAEQK